MNCGDFKSHNTFNKSAHVIVIGSSIAGLLASRILTNHFDLVTIVERDFLPQVNAFRPGAPQSRQLHVLLQRGQDILEQLFPGFRDQLVAAGAHLIDLAGELAWLSPAGWGVRFPSDVTITSCGRTLLEWRIRQRILTIPQIDFLQGSEVTCLLSNENNTGVDGVSVASRHRSGLKTAYSNQLSSADLVVDATGRGSKAPQWLDMMGYPTPLETSINPHLGYASRIYQLPADFQSDWRAMYLQPAPPTTVRGGGLYPLEKNRWIVTLWGGDGDYPPTTEFGFLEFARSLPSPLLYKAISLATPLSPIYGYRATENRLRHYEQLDCWPEGFVLLGDAVCAFNPLYAQGMTVAALGALTLEQCLQEQRRHQPDGSLVGLAQRFQKQLAKVNAAPWRFAISTDYTYRSTVGGSPTWGMQLIQRYLAQIFLLSTKSVKIRKVLLDVLSFLQPPTALFHPRIIIRVIFQVFKQTSHALNLKLGKNVRYVD